MLLYILQLFDHLIVITFFCLGHFKTLPKCCRLHFWGFVLELGWRGNVARVFLWSLACDLIEEKIKLFSYVGGASEQSPPRAT